MKVMRAEWKGRLEHWVRTLKNDFYEPLGEFRWEAFPTMEELSMEDALKQDFTPVTTGFTWGNTWEYCWFRGRITLPEGAAGKRIVMNLKPGGESTLFVNGRGFGTYRAEWVDEPHHFIEDNTLTRKASGGESFDVVMETYAGHFYPEVGGCATGPVIPGSFQDPKEEGRRVTLGSCTYGVWDEDAYQLFMDVDTLIKLLTTLEESSLRAAKIAEALEQFTLIVDFEQEKEKRSECYRAAREALRPVMEAVNGSTMPVFYAVGNAHLDLAWLWPMQETFRKTERTFAAQLRLIEEYPDYKFIQSQPASYEMCRKYYPELFERIKEAIKGGQWIADGAMWVEPDTNMAGGEALIRQLIHGKRYYKEVLGVDSEVLWLPDTFGYSAALPQILLGCGVKYLVTQKIFWSYNDGEKFPYHYFTWEGMDGSRIVSFLPTSYTYRTDPAQISDIWKNRAQARDLDAFLLPFGYGDGGGGPSRDFIEYIERQKDLEGAPKIKMTSPKEFFEEMQEKTGGPKNTYKGELYFSAHRGTYTSQAMVKKNNRRCELALREMEFWGSLALAAGKEYAYDRADALWKKLLLHQFHDILPGSSIARVYVEAEKAFKEILRDVTNITEEETMVLAKDKGEAVTLFNSLSFARKALITLPERFADGAKTMEGEPICIQKEADVVKALVTIPACGFISLTPCEEKKETNEAKVNRIADGYCMENSKVIAKINHRGEVVSFCLKSTGREFAAGAMNRFHLYKDVARLFDAWDIDSNYIDQEVEGAYEINTRILMNGIEAVLEVTGRISESTFVQEIHLAADSTRMEFVTKVDWKELHRLLKVAFPVDVYAENGINEVQFGYVTRPTHRSRDYEKDRFEVCNHRYSALCDGSHGAAVLNNCKYGISMNDNALELTLLKSASSPEMRADNREHEFTYAFTAWEGSFTDADVVQQGYELNVTPLLQDGAAGTFSLVDIDKQNIILDTVKPAEDQSGDIILRFYESKKAAVTSEITVNFGAFKAYHCDMLENKGEEIVLKDNHMSLTFGAFEIKTVRIAR